MKFTQTRLQAAALATASLLLGATSTPVVAGTMPQNSYDHIYTNMGQTTPEARSVGSLTIAWDQDGDNVVRGSGVLVGGRYVLTAAHLVDDSRGGVFTIGGQNYNIRRFVVANQFYNRGEDDDPNPDERVFGGGSDLALIQLDRRVNGARKIAATINRSRKEAGQVATIVGYGRGGSGELGMNDSTSAGTILYAGLAGTLDNNGAGTAVQVQYVPTKRAGKNVVEANGPFGTLTKSNRELVTDFDPDPNLIASLNVAIPQTIYNPFNGEFSIDESDIPIAGEYAPAVGDSGGGLFINGKLAGITSWTSRSNSEYYSQASYTRLSVGWWKWVRDNIKAFNNYSRNPTLTPWLTVANGGNGFRGVARIGYNEDVEDTDDLDGDGDTDELIFVEGQPFNIFGPHLFYDLDPVEGTFTKFDVVTNIDTFIANDLYANPAPLPEPASLALLSLGGLAMLRRMRA